MQATLSTTAVPVSTSAARSWAGRIISALAVLFLALDAAIKVLQLSPAVEASAQLGFGAGATFALGVLLLACLAIYLLPRTAILGATLLTGYLGGAVAIHLQLGSPAFSLIFPVLLGALVWGGLALRDARLRALVGPQR